MGNTLSRYIELKNKAKTAQENASKAEGALGEVKNRLKKEFGCSGIKAAKTKLADLEKQKNQAEKKFDKELRLFKEKWDGKLD